MEALWQGGSCGVLLSEFAVLKMLGWFYIPPDKNGVNTARACDRAARLPGFYSATLASMIFLFFWVVLGRWNWCSPLQSA